MKPPHIWQPEPNPKTPDTLAWFRHDPLAELAGRLNQLREKADRINQLRGGAARLNQLREGQSQINRPADPARSLHRFLVCSATMGCVDFFGWLTTIWGVASLRVVKDPSLGLPGLPATGLIALAAGISTLLGHCTVLFINHVRGIRFLAMLMVGRVFLTLLYTIQALILWVMAGPPTQRGMYLTGLPAVMLSSTAPLAHGFLVFIPHLGLLIGRILQGWSAICLRLLMTAAMETSWWQTLIATDLAWGTMQLASRPLGRPIGYLAGRIWTLVVGRPAILGPWNVLAGAPFTPAEAKAIP